MADDHDGLLGSTEVAAHFEIGKSTGRKVFRDWITKPSTWLDRYPVRSPTVITLADGRHYVSEVEFQQWLQRLDAAGAPRPGLIPRGRRKGKKDRPPMTEGPDLVT